uniref:Uncharacterized protein n=1 Tax=Homalodisca liturata TaxID=320908 RepID=A0A1B6JB10_9HEMI
MAAVDFMFSVHHYPGGDMLLTTCPKCQHNFPLPSPCCQADPLVVSATLHLPSTSTPATCTMTVSARRVQVGMTGGGIVQDSSGDSLILQKGITSKSSSSSGGKLIVNSQQSPEPSPSVPIAFVIPSIPSRWSFPPPDTDLERLSSTMKALRNSGWYYEGLSWQESAALLMPTSPGTFLVRDSSDPRFLFSLSVQTERGPTSVRLHYHEGNFRLDAAPKLVPVMPVFQCVVRLVEYYVSVTNRKSDRSKSKEQVWIDCSGQTYSSILLTKPLLQKGKFPTLQHLARLAINRLGQTGYHVPTHELPETLHRYIAEYPYSQ